jgi:ankyrin repeat protein
MVDFILQNSSSLDRRTREGNTPLHYCVIQNQPEAMRLLLRSGASPDLANNNGKTPLSIAKERGYHLCEELVRAKTQQIFLHFFAEKTYLIKNQKEKIKFPVSFEEEISLKYFFKNESHLFFFIFSWITLQFKMARKG